MSEIRTFFKQITGSEPFGSYQIEPAQYLAQNQSVILRMPTGSGKSESILCSYLWAFKQNLDFPQQMLYGLPMRNLVNSLGNRFAKYQKNFNGLGIAIQHGQYKGTPTLSSDIAIATIDQLISAYACTPLGYSLRNGNIPAGAVGSAFLVFDEVHTFDPERALQSTLFIVEHSHKIGLPFAFLSATLPDLFVKTLEERFNAKTINVDEKDIPRRANRYVKLVNRLDRVLTPTEVFNAWTTLKEGSLLVVCNTVKYAKDLWREVSQTLKGIPVHLLHSEFTAEDRKEKEKEDGILNQLLGESPTKRGIVIATQVVEVGLDVSTTLLLTQLAPVDALIQRAGRVARWGGHGEVRVFNVEKPNPYVSKLVEESFNVLTKIAKPEIWLTWQCEQDLVNKVLGPVFADYMKPEKRAEALYWLGEGAFSGKRREVSKAIRDNQSCTVSIHHDPNSLDKAVWQLPQIRLRVGKLYSLFKELSPADLVWQVVVDEGKNHSWVDQDTLVGAVPVKIPAFSPNRFYVLSPKIARYEPDGRGLVLGELGESMPLMEKKKASRPKYSPGERESWLKHCQNVLEAFYEVYLPSYESVLARLAEKWKLSPDDFINRIALCAALHDLGKLTVEWQQKIGRLPHEEPIGHSGDYNKRRNLPPHATVSAYLVQDLFYEWAAMQLPLMCAIAHHHSVRARQVPDFVLIPEWVQQVNTLLSLYPTLLGLWNPDLVKQFQVQTSSTTLENVIPNIEDYIDWRTYVISSRIIRFSDQMATGGSEYAVLRDEDWLTEI